MAEVKHDGLPVEDVITEEKEAPKGELKLLAILLFMGLAWLYESLKVPGVFQGVSNGPGSIAQLVAVALVLMTVSHGFTLIKSGYKEGTWADVVEYLFGSKVVMMIIAIIAYGLLVETLTFVPASIIFCTVMMYLFERKDLIKKAIISCVFIGVLYLIFSTVFQIVLP